MKKITAVLICFIMILSPLIVSAANGKKLPVDYYCPFTPWEGAGDASAEIFHPDEKYDKLFILEEFQFLSFGNEKFDEACYTVYESDGKLFVEINEEFLKTLDDGLYYFYAEFERIVVQLRLYVFREKAVENDRIYYFEDILDVIPEAYIFHTGHPIGVELFENVKYNNEVLGEDCYEISPYIDGVAVKLSRDFYYSLPAGTHYFDIEFMSVSGIKLKIDIPVRDRVGDVASISYYYESGRSGGVCYIDNDYLKVNYDLLFRDMYENYLTLPEFEFYNGEKISQGFYEDIKHFVNDNYYLCLYLTQTGADVSSIDGVVEVKYTSEKYPCAVVKVIGGDDIDTILADEKVEYVGYSFDFVAPFWGDPGHSVQWTFKASDAREVLRIAAGIDKIEKSENDFNMDEFIKFFARDINMDGKLTAYDARGVLRIAAGLDEEKHIIYPY